MPRFLRSLLCAAAFTGVTTAAVADEATYINPPGDAGDWPFSEAVIYDDFIFLSGQIGMDSATGEVVEGGIGPETRKTMENIQATLERIGASMDDVLKCTVFLADMAEWADMNAEYVKFFTRMPARSALGTANGIALGARVEIECIAAAPDED